MPEADVEECLEAMINYTRLYKLYYSALLPSLAHGKQTVYSSYSSSCNMFCYVLLLRGHMLYDMAYPAAENEQIIVGWMKHAYYEAASLITGW